MLLQKFEVYVLMMLLQKFEVYFFPITPQSKTVNK